MKDKGRLLRYITSAFTVALVVCVLEVPSNLAHAQPTQDYAPHKVQKGETLYSISTTRGFKVNEIAVYNNFAPPYTLSVGQVVYFPRKNPPAPAVQQRPTPPKPVPAPAHTQPAAVPTQPTRAPTSKPAPAPSTNRAQKVATPSPAKPATNAAIRAQSGGWQWPVDQTP
ncbi:MAG: LysM peptidoglycan-binding domain-containing protein, partial [Gammaproteobacteria bacterium]|nr:LysM peptidoglycan-binding domain-containing protein [Gammaproteobacteria bacterium]